MNLADKIEDDLHTYGRSVISVFPDTGSRDPNDAFAYTIGNARVHLPELLIIGSCSPTVGAVINELSRVMMRRGKAFRDGEYVDLGGKFPLFVVNANESVKNDYTIQATNYFGRRAFSVMQVVMPDEQGHFPWQAECDERYAVIIHSGTLRTVKCPKCDAGKRMIELTEITPHRETAMRSVKITCLTCGGRGHIPSDLRTKTGRP